MNKMNAKIILNTKYQLFYTFKDSAINHEIKLNAYWLNDKEKEQVYKFAYKTDLKQMEEVNRYNLNRGEKALYSSIMLIKYTTTIQDNKVNKDIKIIKSNVLNSQKEVLSKCINSMY